VLPQVLKQGLKATVVRSGNGASAGGGEGSETLAGAVVPMDACLRNFLAFTHCSVPDAVAAAASRPAALLHQAALLARTTERAARRAASAAARKSVTAATKASASVRPAGAAAAATRRGRGHTGEDEKDKKEGGEEEEEEEEEGEDGDEGEDEEDEDTCLMGTLRAGAVADLVLLDAGNLEVLATFRDGCCVWDRERGYH